MKKIIKKIIPKSLFLKYHYFLALFAAFFYGFPSKKMIVIGVTGTKGKTSTINFIWSALQRSGIKTGIITTANIRIGDTETMNAFHMTMPGRFVIQRLMAQMVKENCKICLVETTSEGLKQYRHIGVYYDIAVFTNLTPEHLQSHEGSFDKYKAMKTKMFSAISNHEKIIDGNVIKKLIVSNNDSEHGQDFLNFDADAKITYSINESSDYKADHIEETSEGVDFELKGEKFHLSILGKFNVYNALPAIAIGNFLGIKNNSIRSGLSNLQLIPGRMEQIKAGQNFTMIVDYAHEKQSITGVLETANAMKPTGAKTIILLGAEGGGRDKAKRPIMGEISAKLADYVVVSNVDPYEDDPKEIVEDIAVVAEKFGKKRNENLFVIEDRRLGIRKAIALAKENDIVLITGKGAEQSMIIGGISIPWDDRDVVKEELRLAKK